jgi:hypothetical protein
MLMSSEVIMKDRRKCVAGSATYLHSISCLLQSAKALAPCAAAMCNYTGHDPSHRPCMVVYKSPAACVQPWPHTHRRYNQIHCGTMAGLGSILYTEMQTKAQRTEQPQRACLVDTAKNTVVYAWTRRFS